MVHYTLCSDATVTRGKHCELADCFTTHLGSCQHRNRVCAFHKAISNMWEKIGHINVHILTLLACEDWNA